jgi:hypothetical protein
MKLRHVECKAAMALRRHSPGSSLRISETLPALYLDSRKCMPSTSALPRVLLALAAALEESVCQHINTLRIPPRPSGEASPSLILLQINIQPVFSSLVYRDVASPPGLFFEFSSKKPNHVLTHQIRGRAARRFVRANIKCVYACVPLVCVCVCVYAKASRSPRNPF